MKAFQKIFAALSALLLCVSTGAGAFASEVGDPDWDTVSAAVLAQYNLEENQVYAGYRNLVTGEEHYINGDEYAVAASMFKVPLCMYATEELHNGNIDWSVYEQYFSKTGDDTPAIIASTASPYKFSRSVLEAVAPSEVLPETEFDMVDMLHELTGMPVPAPLAGLKDKTARFSDVTAADKMEDYVLKALSID